MWQVAIFLCTLLASAEAGVSLDEPLRATHPALSRRLQNDEPDAAGVTTCKLGVDNMKNDTHHTPQTLGELLEYYHNSRLEMESMLRKSAPSRHDEYSILSQPHGGHSDSLRAHLRHGEGCDPRVHIDAYAVWTPKEGEDYDKVRLNQYAQFLGPEATAQSALKPAVIVECSEETHVQSAVRFAGRCGYKVTARSGGHSYTGASSCNDERCMQLDLGRMDKVTVKGNGLTSDGGTVTTGPGILLNQFATHTLGHLLTVPHGGCADVGFGGHYQSSAWGMLTQSHGSGLDYVKSFRLVKADGEVMEVSRDDRNSTYYKAVLGSAPGSWGVITQYTMDAIGDRTVPHSRMIFIKMAYSKENFLKAFRHSMFIVKDQEEKGLRDMKVLFVVGPSTRTKDITPEMDAFMFWSGIDSGPMTKYWKNRYLTPFWDIEHSCFPKTLNIPAPMSYVTRMMTDHWVNRNDRYAVNSFHSDYWWDDEFIQIMVDEVHERMQMIPEVYPNFQFLPIGHSSQWTRNAGMNSLTWRDTKAYVDDWMFVTNITRYDEVVERMKAFREKTQRYWEYKSGVADRSTWMSPSSLYPEATNLANPDTASSFFPDPGHFEHLQKVKAELDPHGLFSNEGTVPLPH